MATLLIAVMRRINNYSLLSMSKCAGVRGYRRSVDCGGSIGTLAWWRPICKRGLNAARPMVGKNVVEGRPTCFSWRHVHFAVASRGISSRVMRMSILAHHVMARRGSERHFCHAGVGSRRRPGAIGPRRRRARVKPLRRCLRTPAPPSS